MSIFAARHKLKFKGKGSKDCSTKLQLDVKVSSPSLVCAFFLRNSGETAIDTKSKMEESS